jgi:hypothetical protein
VSKFTKNGLKTYPNVAVLKQLRLVEKNDFNYLTSEFVHYGYEIFTAQVSGADPKKFWSKYTHYFL